jgi:hypothetical protein
MICPPFHKAVKPSAKKGFYPPSKPADPPFCWVDKMRRLAQSSLFFADLLVSAIGADYFSETYLRLQRTLLLLMFVFRLRSLLCRGTL